MKILPKIHIAILATSLFAISSCELTPTLDEYKPLYALDAENSVVDEASAELTLTGAYAGTGSDSPSCEIIPDILSGYAQTPSNNTSAEKASWAINDPIVIGSSESSDAYTRMYNMINRSNWVIKEVGKLTDADFKTPGRRAAIIGEAKILRAFWHFKLLRLWGQFYDPNSLYGIDVRTSPAKSGQAYPRKTVAETYASILQDLNDGILDAPDLRTKDFVNKTFARGFKAKVLLYKGDYTGAAAAAKEVLDQTNANFKLATSYASIFDHSSTALFSSPEVLFQSKGEPNLSIQMGAYYRGSYAAVTQSYINAAAGFMLVGGQKIAYDDTRVSSMFPVNSGYRAFYVNKYVVTGATGFNEMFCHLRMAEVYLIFAEASARSSKSVSLEALNALNAVRIRAGATATPGDGFKTYPTTIAYNQFLEAVRMEKLVELQCEGGESWYDLIRYDYADGFGTGFKVSDVKATAKNPDKFILPIPYVSINAGGNIIKQNPSYD